MTGGRVALVVGGSRGIGAVVSQAIAASGGRVVATYATNEGAARALQADVRAHRPSESFEICHFDSINPSGISASYSFGDRRFGELEIFVLDDFAKNLAELLEKLFPAHPASISVKSAS